MTSRKHPSAAFWVSVALVVALVGYPLSFGPARALYVHRLVPEWTYRPMRFFHLPIVWALPRMQDEIREPCKNSVTVAFVFAEHVLKPVRHSSVRPVDSRGKQGRVSDLERIASIWSPA